MLLTDSCMPFFIFNFHFGLLTEIFVFLSLTKPRIGLEEAKEAKEKEEHVEEVRESEWQAEGEWTW